MFPIKGCRSSIVNFKKMDSNITSSGLRFLLKSIPFSISLYIALILLLSGDIELNPGPPTPSKSVNGTLHQGDLPFGNTAGSQCMCNTLWAICYSKIKNVRYWKQWDLDTILHHGNELYKEKGHLHEQLSFEELPDNLSINGNIIDVLKSDEKTAELFPDSQAFPRSELWFNCGILVSCGYSSAFMYESDSIYIFDSHSRDANGLPAVDGTSVFLKFNPREVAGSYIKSIYLDHFCNPSVYYQI